MTFEEFDKFREQLFADLKEIADTKGLEYCIESDNRFANLDREGNELGVRNIFIAWVYCRKHLNSIGSFVKRGKVLSNESIRSRIIDAIAFLTLIAGMIEEDQIQIDAKRFTLQEEVTKPKPKPFAKAKREYKRRKRFLGDPT